MSLITNRKAGFNYEIMEKYVSGIELFGYEVKSIRKGQGSLEGSHITIRGNEAYIVGMTIPPFQPNNTPKEYDQNRNRKLLLNKKEVLELGKAEKTKGLTIVPLSVYNKGRVLKVDLAVAKGKKKYDKRESIKKQDTERQVRREVSDR